MHDVDLELVSDEARLHQARHEPVVEAKTAVVANIARTSITFALTGADGRLRPETVHRYDSAAHATVSGAFFAFSKETGLSGLPKRCGIAVAGVPRGDTISVTNSRLFISKSALKAVFDQWLVINDFAANAWSVSTADPGLVQPAGAAAPGARPGTYLVIGMWHGLGVAAFIRDTGGHVTVLPTEAGHAELVDSAPEIAPLVEIIRRRNGHCTAETLLTSQGMAALANVLAGQQGGAARYRSAEDVIAAAGRGDCAARKASVLFAKALWRYAGNLTLVFGAWDGLFLTGRIVDALRPVLALPEVRQGYVIPGPFANLLHDVPAGFLLIENSELHGVAEALRRLP